MSEKARERVERALAVQGIPSEYDRAFREPNADPGKTLTMRRAAIYDCAVGTQPCEPEIRIYGSGTRVRRIPSLIELPENDPALNYTVQADQLERLDHIAETVTALYITGGVLHQSGTLAEVKPSPEIVLGTAEAPVEIFKRTLFNPKLEKETLVITPSHPGLFDSLGYKFNFDFPPDYVPSSIKSQASYAFLVFADAARLNPGEFFDFKRDFVTTWDNMGRSSEFYSTLESSVLAMLNGKPIQQGLGDWPGDNSPIRTVPNFSADEPVISEIYTLSVAAQRLTSVLLTDLKKAQPELYPKSSNYYRLTKALRRMINGSNNSVAP